MQFFYTADGFVELFSIDPKNNGARDFCTLADLVSLMLHFPQYNVSVSDLARIAMAEQRISPLVYWSRMKRALEPVFDAADSLPSLGVSVAGETLTCPLLAHAVGVAMSSTLKPDLCADLAAETARLCGRAK